MEKIVLGGGCFWCIEAIFKSITGVISVISGYAGGQDLNPNYESVCSGRTGHAEVVMVSFDPDISSLESILEVFWKAHDPTTLNRQGNDVGTQYRSAIYYYNNSQKKVIEKSIDSVKGNFSNPIVTEVSSLTEFYPAENYHQSYYENNPQAPYCSRIILPKLKKLGLD